jgi:anti-anti-sigma factor
MSRKRPFGFHTFELTPANSVVFELEGRLRGDAASYGFQDAVIAQLAGGAGRVILDLGQIDAIDGRGIGILAAAYGAARQAGGELALASVPAPIDRLLNVFWFLRGLPRVDLGTRRSVRCVARRGDGAAADRDTDLGRHGYDELGLAPAAP